MSDHSGDPTAPAISGWVVPVTLSCLLHAGIIGGTISLESWLISVAPHVIPIELAPELKIEPPRVIEPSAPAVKKTSSREMPGAPKAVETLAQPAPVAAPPPPPAPKPEALTAPQAPSVALPQMKAVQEEASKSMVREVSVVQESRAVAGPTGSAGSSGSSPAPATARDAERVASLREALADSRLTVASRTAPRYPESARRAGAQGTTLLKVRVLATGQIGEIQIEESAGHPSLDQASIDAVRRWRFEPGKENGKPVDLWVLIPFEFRLK